VRRDQIALDTMGWVIPDKIAGDGSSMVDSSMSSLLIELVDGEGGD